MINTTQEKTAELIKTTTGIGGMGLLIIEDHNDWQETIREVKEELFHANYSECADYLGIIDVFSHGKDKIFYIEQGEQIESIIVKIVDDFHLGRAVVMDGKNHTGMKVVEFDPTKTSFIIVVSRKQLESSYSKLMEYITFTQAI